METYYEPQETSPIENYEQRVRFSENLEEVKVVEDPEDPEIYSDKNIIKMVNKKSSEELNYLAIQNWPPMIKYIKEPSEFIQLEAVKRSGLCINFIKDPSESVQLEAVKKYNLAIDFIEKPTKKVLEYLGGVQDSTGGYYLEITNKFYKVQKFKPSIKIDTGV